ncbi:MAG: HAMP domain-containing histidine kinase [Lachnospiraceae bacterium]|nr:HAMP domain-containing histidine kinase [Lachnospiraceae bacterium]
MRIIKAKRQKRKTFKQILIKKLIATAIITTLVLLVLSLFSYQAFIYIATSEFYIEESYSVEAVTQVYEKLEEKGVDMNSEEGRDIFLKNLKFRFYSNDYMATAILDGETYQPIWSGEQTAIAIVLVENEDVNTTGSVYYEIEGDIPQEYIDMYNYVQDAYTYVEVGREPEEELDGLYINDGRFKFSKYTLREYDKKGKAKITEYELTPTDLEGYTFVPQSEAKIMVVGLFGTPKDTTLYNQLDYYIKYITENNHNEGYYYDNMQTIGFLDMGMANSSKVTLPNGETIIICKQLYVDIWKEWGKYIVLVYVLAYVLALAIAAVVARIKYLKLKSAYDMEDYRITMTNTMAHDLKSPLMSISGYAENLKENINTDKKEYYADSILENVTYMNAIIGNVLELSKVETATEKLNRTDVVVEELIERLANFYKDAMEEKTLKLEVEGSLTIKADEKLMQQVFDNLITNAIKYSNEGTTIKVELSKKRRKSRITFTNVSTEDIGKEAENLWKPFVKGDNSRSNKQGTGVGLAIVKDIVELHGYRLKLSCEEGIFKAEIKL